jgi:hypothetical protein
MSKAKAKALERAQRLANEGVAFTPADVAEELDALQGAGAAAAGRRPPPRRSAADSRPPRAALARFRELYVAFTKLGSTHAELQGLKQARARGARQRQAAAACLARR